MSKNEILVASLDGCVRQYDIRAGKMRTDKIGSTVMGATYSNDGNCILVSTLDNKVRLLDKMTGELLNDFSGHKNEKYKTQAILSNDDALVVSGSEDHNVGKEKMLFFCFKKNNRFLFGIWWRLESCKF